MYPAFSFAIQISSKYGCHLLWYPLEAEEPWDSMGEQAEVGSVCLHLPSVPVAEQGTGNNHFVTLFCNVDVIKSKCFTLEYGTFVLHAYTYVFILLVLYTECVAM